MSTLKHAAAFSRSKSELEARRRDLLARLTTASGPEHQRICQELGVLRSALKEANVQHASAESATKRTKFGLMLAIVEEARIHCRDNRALSALYDRLDDAFPGWDAGKPPRFSWRGK